MVSKDFNYLSRREGSWNVTFSDPTQDLLLHLPVTISFLSLLQAHIVLQLKGQRYKDVFDTLEDHIGDLALLDWTTLC